MEMNKNFTFGTRKEPAANAAETRILNFVFSDGGRDRHHAILNQDAWKLDNYRKNPVAKYMHSDGEGLLSSPDPDYVIGKSIDIGIESRKLVGSIHFEPASINLLADKIFRKLLFGSLRSTSVGFLEVGEGSWGTGDEAQGRINETYRFAGQELLEVSVVNIPSNPAAVKRGKRSVRSQGRAAVLFALSELNHKYTVSQIENMRISQVLDLLDGKDLGIRETDPIKLRKILDDKQAGLDIISIIEKQQVGLKTALLKSFKV